VCLAYLHETLQETAVLALPTALIPIANHDYLARVLAKLECIAVIRVKWEIERCSRDGTRGFFQPAPIGRFALYLLELAKRKEADLFEGIPPIKVLVLSRWVRVHDHRVRPGAPMEDIGTRRKAIAAPEGESKMLAVGLVPNEELGLDPAATPFVSTDDESFFRNFASKNGRHARRHSPASIRQTSNTSRHHRPNDDEVGLPNGSLKTVSASALTSRGAMGGCQHQCADLEQPKDPAERVPHCHSATVGFGEHRK
jgi:hypothetical protein